MTTRWWQLIFFIFTLIFVEMRQFDDDIFQMGWFNHQPVWYIEYVVLDIYIFIYIYTYIFIYLYLPIYIYIHMHLSIFVRWKDDFPSFSKGRLVGLGRYAHFAVSGKQTRKSNYETFLVWILCIFFLTNTLPCRVLSTWDFLEKNAMAAAIGQNFYKSHRLLLRCNSPK